VSTDFQQARVSLGVRLRELRTEAQLTGVALAARLEWQSSKISKLEHGKQTPTSGDLAAWASAVGRPDAAGELQARLSGMETSYRSWRRQLAGGLRARQDASVVETRRTEIIRGFEGVRIPGIFQTAEYARHLLTLNADFYQSPRDIEEAVRARMRRQEALYEPGHRFRFLVWEAALHVLVCPPSVMAAQLDRLTGLAGLDTIDLGIIPLGVPMRRTPAHGFWIYDERLVTVEMINAELWLEDAADVALYARAWEWLNEIAVYGPLATRLIGRAAAALEAR
jgi:transcriptional regulator with XRE-family HTH domain